MAGFLIGDRVHHINDDLYGIVISEEYYSCSIPSYVVAPEKPPQYHRGIADEEVWWSRFLVAAPKEPLPKVSTRDYPHKHEVCGSPAFIGFMSIECTKCGKLGM